MSKDEVVVRDLWLGCLDCTKLDRSCDGTKVRNVKEMKKHLWLDKMVPVSRYVCDEREEAGLRA